MRVIASALLLCGAMAAHTAPRSYPLTLLNGSRLLVEASVNGRGTQALLDSAAEATLLNAAFAERLQLKGTERVTGQGSGARTFAGELLHGVELQAFDVTLRDQTVAIADLSDIGHRLLGRPLDMILGREIFDAARLQIDIDGGRVMVLPADAAALGTRLGLVTEHGVETIPARVEGRQVRATFDLGNGGQVLISSRLAQQLHVLSDGRGATTRPGGGLGGEVVRQIVTLHSLELAGRSFHDVQAAIDAKSGASDLNVGVSILHNFLITSDFSRHAVWLQWRPPTNEPSRDADLTK